MVLWKLIPLKIDRKKLGWFLNPSQSENAIGKKRKWNQAVNRSIFDGDQVLDILQVNEAVKSQNNETSFNLLTLKLFFSSRNSF